MIFISLFFLFVYLFGAYAYGAATVYSLRSLWPVQGGRTDDQAGRHRVDLALFALSTVWFALHILIEFRSYTTLSGNNWLDVVMLTLVFLFPPLVMHTVYIESVSAGNVTPPLFRRLLDAMYVLSPAIGAWLVAAVFGLLPVPEPIGLSIGLSIGGLFTLASVYGTALMLRRQQAARTPDQRRLRAVIIALFALLTVTFVALIVMREQRLMAGILNRIAFSSPLYFLIASVYFENHFEFYDRVVKRALMILLSVSVLGVFLAATLPFLQLLPATAARPWLFAMSLAPLAMVMSWLLSRTERWLDRMWLGREFTPVEAVKHVIAAMQPAVDERTLADAAQARLSDIFGTPILVLWGDQAVEGPVEHDIALTSPVSGERLRIVVTRAPGTRRLLSEDLAMLRSLGGVLGFMLEAAWHRRAFSPSAAIAFASSPHTRSSPSSSSRA